MQLIALGDQREWGWERAWGSVLLGGEDKGWVCGLVGMSQKREREEEDEERVPEAVGQG